MTKKHGQPSRALKHAMHGEFSEVSQYGLDLVKEISEIMSAEIQAEVDRQIINKLRVTMLQEQGWVAIPSQLPRKDINDWLGLHCHGPYHVGDAIVVFQNLDDAVWFELSQE